MAMTTKLLRLIIAAGMLWIPVKTGLLQCMPTPTKGKFKSFLLHHTPSNSKPFLKVEVGSNNNVTGIAFVGDHNQPNVTEFLINRCRIATATGFELVIIIQWSLRPSYTLAVRSGRVVLERTSSITDARYHFYSGGVRNPKCFNFKSKTAGKFIKTNLQGQVKLGSMSSNRATWLMDES